MQLTREDFQKFLYTYNEDELFYRTLYFEKKEHPETFHKFCLNLDCDLISRRQLYVPELQKEGWHSYFEENGNTVYLQSDKNDVGGKKHKKLRYVWVEKPKKINSMMSVRYSMLNAMMIEDGYATPKEEYGNVKYQEDFQNIYEQAFCDE